MTSLGGIFFFSSLTSQRCFLPKSLFISYVAADAAELMPQPQVCLNHSLLVSGGAVPPPALRWNLAVSNLTHKRGCRREYTNAQYDAQPTLFKGQVYSNRECNFQVSNKIKAASREKVVF